MSSLDTDEEIETVFISKIETFNLIDYLKKISSDKIKLNSEKKKLENKYTNFITHHNVNEKNINDEIKEIEDNLKNLLKGKKTIILKKIQDYDKSFVNFEFVDSLHLAFPTVFKQRLTKLQKIDTKEDKFICNRLIVKINKNTNKPYKSTCLKELKTKASLTRHLEKHKQTGDLV